MSNANGKLLLVRSLKIRVHIINVVSYTYGNKKRGEEKGNLWVEIVQGNFYYVGPPTSFQRRQGLEMVHSRGPKINKQCKELDKNN